MKWPRAAARNLATSAGLRLDKTSGQFRNWLTQGLTVFMFHEITDTPSQFQREARIYTLPLHFRQQVEWIHQRFTVISPMQLPQFGGDVAALPKDAALLTFDDAWSGICKNGIPLLSEMGLPCIWFINMATVVGDPDLAAVEAFESSRSIASTFEIRELINVDEGERILAEARKYGSDSDFLRFQGDPVTQAGLELISGCEDVWFGSHLYHHWRLTHITADLYEQSKAQNGTALSDFQNAIPALAVPYGLSDGIFPSFALNASRDMKIVFIATCKQNSRVDSWLLDRLYLPDHSVRESDLWHATHRARLLRQHNRSV